MTNSRLKQFFSNSLYSNATDFIITTTNSETYDTTISDIDSRILSFIVIPIKHNGSGTYGP
jgi:hypothetical protein